MKILEQINRLLILAWAYFRFKTAKEKGNNALIFCNRMGIGNFIEYLPTLKVLDKKHNCHFIFKNQAIEFLWLKVIGDHPWSKPYFDHYDYVYCNYLNQTKENIKEIIRLNIPNRYGHDCKGKNKWKSIFNLTMPMYFEQSEVDSNLMLAIKFYYEHKPFKFNNKKEDYIAIQVYSPAEPWKNYGDYKGLIKALNEHGQRVVLVGTDAEKEPYKHLNCEVKKETFESTCNIIQSAKLYIGNDSGLSHVAWLCGTKSIVIWMVEQSINRSIHENNINLYRPNTEILLTCINGII